jgi:hypothetical protein
LIQNAFHGALGSANLASVNALVGDQEQAITRSSGCFRPPAQAGFLIARKSITLAELRLRWE